MNVSFTRRLSVLVGVALVPAVFVALPEFLADDRLVCERAQEWVGAHKEGLPSSADDIGAFPITYQREIFSELPAEAKSRVWRAHLAHALHLPLSAAQRKLIYEAMAIATPELFARHVALGEEFLRGVEKEFPAQLRDEIFQRLGPADGSFSTLASARVVAREKLIRVGTALAAPWCNCSSSSSYCQPLPTSPTRICCCSGRYGNCIPKPYCGTLFAFTCDGMCTDPVLCGGLS